MPHPSPLRRFIWIVFFSVLIGALYGDLRYGVPGAGAIVAGSMGAALFSLDRFVLRRNAGGLFPRLPFLPYLALRTCLYAAVIIIINSIANSVLSGRFMVIGGVDLLFSLVFIAAVTLLLSVNELLGPGTLIAFAAGRYYHPRIEERALLFIDMRASTAIAERVGELRILDLLNRFVADVSLAVAEAGGEIHKYVGDEVIATWRLAPGANQVDCVRACFGAFDRIDAQRSAYERDFGLVPDFRGYGFHRIRPEGATADLIGYGDLATRQITHRWNRSQSDDEARPRERFALSRPQAPKGRDRDVSGQCEKQSACDPAGQLL